MSSLVSVIEKLRADKQEASANAGASNLIPLTEEEKAKRTLQALPDEGKRARAWKMRCDGLPVSSISTVFGVTEATIYNWFTKLKQEFNEHFIKESASELLAEQLMMLDNLETVCLYEINQLSKESKTFDSKTGAVVEANIEEIKVLKGAKAKFLASAIKIREMKIKLLTDIGAIPKEPEKLDLSLNDHRRLKDDEDSRVNLSEKSQEELISEIMTRLKRQVLL
jgi:hypothetical protein